MSRDAFRVVATLGAAATLVWAAHRAVTWWLVLEIRRIGPDPLLADAD